MRLALTKASVLGAMRYGTPHPVPIPGHLWPRVSVQHAAGFQHFGIKHFAFVGNKWIIPQRHLKRIVATINIIQSTLLKALIR